MAMSIALEVGHIFLLLNHKTVPQFLDFGDGWPSVRVRVGTQSWSWIVPFVPSVVN